MATGDFGRVGLDPDYEHLPGLGREHLVLGADHIEIRLIVPGRNIDGCFERNVVQRKLGFSPDGQRKQGRLRGGRWSPNDGG